MKRKSFKGSFDDLLQGNDQVSKKTVKTNDPLIEKKYTLLLPADLIDKIKWISYAERKLIKDTFTEAISTYVKEYEEKKGAVRLPYF